MRANWLSSSFILGWNLGTRSEVDSCKPQCQIREKNVFGPEIKYIRRRIFLLFSSYQDFPYYSFSIDVQLRNVGEPDGEDEEFLAKDVEPPLLDTG